MSRIDLVLAAVGVYLLTALVVAAWRRSAGLSDAVSAWVALIGVWAIGTLPRWLDQSIALSLGLGAGLMLVCWTLVRLTRRLSGRSEHEKVGWLLGPVHALGLAGAWLTASRRRARTAQRQDERADAPISEDVESVVELAETTVGEVMVPRSEMVVLDASARVADWVALLSERPHSFIPVYREDLDEIVGCLRIESLYQQPDPDLPVARFLHEIRFVPESMRCDDLLRDLIAAGEQIALVVDEFGGTAGLVSDEELFEILLGEISQDDPWEGQVQRVSPGTYEADGHCRIDDLNEVLPSPLPEGDYETLAGWVLEKLGRIPAAGERVEEGSWVVEIKEASARRILKLTLSAPKGASRPRAAGGRSTSAAEDRRRPEVARSGRGSEASRG